MSDTLGRKTTLLLGNLGYLLTSLIFFTPSIGTIGMLWIIGGFAMGLHTLGGESYLIDTAHPNYLGLLAALAWLDRIHSDAEALQSLQRPPPPRRAQSGGGTSRS